jgi:hypothetical protein
MGQAAGWQQSEDDESSHNILFEKKKKKMSSMFLKAQNNILYCRRRCSQRMDVVFPHQNQIHRNEDQ